MLIVHSKADRWPAKSITNERQPDDAEAVAGALIWRPPAVSRGPCSGWTCLLVGQWTDQTPDTAEPETLQ